MNQQPGRIVYTLWCLAITLLIVFEELTKPVLRLFQRPPSGPRVTIAGRAWRYSWSWRWFTGRQLRNLVKAKLAEPLGKNVIIHVGSGGKSGVMEDGSFHLHLWCNPTGSAFRNTPEMIWGLATVSPDASLASTGMGSLVYDSNGWDVAELIGDENLFVHHNIVSTGSEAELALLERLLAEALEVVGTPAPERADRARKKQAERRGVSRRALVERYLDPRFLDKAHSLRATIEKETKGIEATERALFASARSSVEQEREAAEAEALLDARTRRFTADFDKIEQVKGVESVVWENGRIVILTETLYATNPKSGARHLIGRFRIEIFPGGEYGGVLFHNLTQRIDGWEPKMNAPHILSTGRPCTGNTQELFPKLIGANQFAQLATLAVRFPQSVNPNDKAGKYIESWPKA